MLSVVGVAVATSLGVGAWRFSSTEAPIAVWPLGPMVAVVLLLELAYCVVAVFLFSNPSLISLGRGSLGNPGESGTGIPANNAMAKRGSTTSGRG